MGLLVLERPYIRIRIELGGRTLEPPGGYE
jgi:hypothetical protein